jgi:hypothetical protein
MENIPPNELSKLASFLTGAKSKNPDDLSLTKVILPDECGDSLWEEVLAQENEVVPAKHISGNKDLPPGDEDIQAHNAGEVE